jgi:hypothetical protein
MKKLSFIPLQTGVAALLLAAVSLPAQAISYTVQNGTYFSTQAGANTIDFGVSEPNNSGPVAGSAAAGDLVYSGSAGGVDYNYVDGALYNLTTSPITDITARPMGSAGNFWSVGNNPASQVGPGVASFLSGLSYFGFLWGSPDAHNTVSFYDGQTLLGSFSGGAALDPADGNQAVAKYFNVFAGADEQITRVTFASSANAFETDNHAFVSAVPEPETYAMLLAGLGLVGSLVRRRKNQNR